MSWVLFFVVWVWNGDEDEGREVVNGSELD